MKKNMTYDVMGQRVAKKVIPSSHILSDVIDLNRQKKVRQMTHLFSYDRSGLDILPFLLVVRVVDAERG